MHHYQEINPTNFSGLVVLHPYYYCFITKLYTLWLNSWNLFLGSSSRDGCVLHLHLLISAHSTFALSIPSNVFSYSSKTSLPKLCPPILKGILPLHPHHLLPFYIKHLCDIIPFHSLWETKPLRVLCLTILTIWQVIPSPLATIPNFPYKLSLISPSSCSYYKHPSSSFSTVWILNLWHSFHFRVSLAYSFGAFYMITWSVLSPYLLFYSTSFLHCKVFLMLCPSYSSFHVFIMIQWRY